MSTPSARIPHMVELVREAVPRIHHAGWPVIAGVAGSGLVVQGALRAAGFPRSARMAGRVTRAATVGSALFFRVPDRVPPMDADLVVAPADGVISQVDRAAPPAETGLGDEVRPRVSIFLSLLDVHVQWAPVAGTVAAAHYHPGTFLSADLDKASETNERNSLVIRPTATGGPPLVVTQIAGLLARRIVCEAAAGDDLARGQCYGLIRFGSRLDTYLPPGTEPGVTVGQRAVGGETPLARLAGAQP